MEVKFFYVSQATPHMMSKRKSMHGRKLRPKSVLDGLGAFAADTHFGSSAGGAPDLLPKMLQQSHDRLDRVAELPSSSHQLQHLVKGRPKRAKNKAPTRPLVACTDGNNSTCSELGEGLDNFFPPSSASASVSSATPTPSHTPPMVAGSPTTSEGCSTLSLAESLKDDGTVCSSSEAVDGDVDGEGGRDRTPTMDSGVFDVKKKS